jgi:DNA-binding IclR family transcriptional regulator
MDAVDGLSGSHSNSAARAVAIVEFLASRPGQTFTLSDIARRCGLRKSTAYTILGTLHDAGWLTRSPADLRYGLGPTLIVIGRAAEETKPEVNLARPILQTLAVEFQRECVLSTAMGDEILVLESTGPAGVRGRSLHAGQRVPLVPPFGTVFVAWQESPARKEWYRRSALADPGRIEELEEILEATVRRGYVVTRRSDPHDRMDEVMKAVSEELTIQDVRKALKDQLSRLPPVAYLVGEHAAADGHVVDSLQAPIFDIDETPRYALTVNDIDRDLDQDTVARLGARVRAAADQVTAAIAAHTRQTWNRDPDMRRSRA